MAKLAALPDAQTIVAFRQKVDFYYWKGIPCARAWPRHHVPTLSTRELQTQRTFSAAAKITGMMNVRMQEAYRDMVDPGKGWSWVDMFRATARGNSWIRPR